ncbi:MAG: DUF4391 domain-containing protein [Candidatus Omnitrophota bacterium]
MTIEDFLNIIKFPEKGRVDKKIFKKSIYGKAPLTRKQVEIVKNEINDIRWHCVLKPETTNIPVFKNNDFDYEEIQVIGVSLKTDEKKDIAAGIIQKCIPYPVVLILGYEGQIALSVAAKRINKTDISKSVIDEEFITNWISTGRANKAKAFINSLQLENLSFTNLFKFYSDFADRVKLFCACEHKENYIYENKSKTDKAYKLFQKIKELEEEKTALRRQIKKETDFAKKVDLNVAIKKMQRDTLFLIAKSNK